MAGTFNTGLSEAQISNAFSRALGDYTNAQIDTKIAQKQDTIADLADIRSGAEAGATAVQPAALAAETDAREAADSEMQTAINARATIGDILGTGALIPDNSDLNDYVTPGNFYGVNSTGNTVANLPIPNGTFHFHLIVQKLSVTFTAQWVKIASTAEAGALYFRSKGSSTWTQWYKFEATPVASSTQSTAALMNAMPGKSAEITAEDESEEMR